MSLKLAAPAVKKEKFSDLDEGVVFIDGDGDLCIKIDETNDGYNAVTLKAGTTFECMGEYVEVLPQGTKLEVE